MLFSDWSDSSTGFKANPPQFLLLEYRLIIFMLVLFGGAYQQTLADVVFGEIVSQYSLNNLSI